MSRYGEKFFGKLFVVDFAIDKNASTRKEKDNVQTQKQLKEETFFNLGSEE